MTWPENQLFLLKTVTAFSGTEGSQTLTGTTSAQGDMQSLDDIASTGMQMLSSSSHLPVADMGRSPVPLPGLASHVPQTPINQNTHGPTTPTFLNQQPQTPKDNLPSPSPSPPRTSSTPAETQIQADKDMDKIIHDPEYMKSTSALIQTINKAHVEWARKQNELQLCLTRSKNNKNTQGSELERQLEAVISNGDAENQKLGIVEEKFVLNKVITQEEQAEVKTTIARIGKASKNGAKVKHF